MYHKFLLRQQQKSASCRMMIGSRVGEMLWVHTPRALSPFSRLALSPHDYGHFRGLSTASSPIQAFSSPLLLGPDNCPPIIISVWWTEISFSALLHLLLLLLLRISPLLFSFHKRHLSHVSLFLSRSSRCSFRLRLLHVGMARRWWLLWGAEFFFCVFSLPRAWEKRKMKKNAARREAE